jgi:hypothetical protein
LVFFCFETYQRTNRSNNEPKETLTKLTKVAMMSYEPKNKILSPSSVSLLPFQHSNTKYKTKKPNPINDFVASRKH